MMLDNRSLQSFLFEKGFYKGALDGKFGKNSNTAVTSLLTASKVDWKLWTSERARTAAEQLFFSSKNWYKGPIDGMVGPDTLMALERYQNYMRDQPLPAVSVQHLPRVFPREMDLREYYGEPGTRQTRLNLPYTMYLAWDTTQKVESFLCHEMVEPVFKKVFTAIGMAYGSKIHSLGLDLFGGCLNVRKKRGGNSMSVHSWGVAVDLDPEHNSLRMTNKNARFARPEYDEMWNIIEGEGLVSLGRERNYDWMHFQAARL